MATQDRVDLGLRPPVSPAISRGPQPVRSRASQTRASISAGLRRGERCGRLQRSRAHAPDTSSPGAVATRRTFHLCAGEHQPDKLAPTSRSETSSSVLTHPDPPSL
jgi:hypothetical protein